MSYRPISLTSICSKLKEHILCHDIMGHLESNHIISDFQYGFQPSHSCEAQLISVTEEIKAALDHCKQVDLLMQRHLILYVPHKCLLSKLEYYGIHGKLLSWLTTWLTKRSQRVVINGYASSLVDVLSGVPQGNVLGPVMFLLYIKMTVMKVYLHCDVCLLMIVFV